MKTKNYRVWLGAAMLACAAGYAVLGTAADKKPPQQWDGLELTPAKGLDLVYMRPGVDFKVYKEFFIDTNVPVEFMKNWQRDQNDATRDLSRKVTSDDMQKIRAGLGKMVHDGLKKELSKSGYSVVDALGPDTLRLSPGVINLYVNAPDIDSASRTRSYTTNGAGEMTLVLEARDGDTGQLLARVIDHRADQGGTGQITWANSVSNAAQADLIIEAWAKRLRQGADRLSGKTEAKAADKK